MILNSAEFVTLTVSNFGMEVGIVRVESESVYIQLRIPMKVDLWFLHPALVSTQRALRVGTFPEMGGEAPAVESALAVDVPNLLVGFVVLEADGT